MWSIERSKIIPLCRVHIDINLMITIWWSYTCHVADYSKIFKLQVPLQTLVINIFMFEKNLFFMHKNIIWLFEKKDPDTQTDSIYVWRLGTTLRLGNQKNQQEFMLMKKTQRYNMYHIKEK